MHLKVLPAAPSTLSMTSRRVDDEPEGCVVWEPLVDSDDDGVVNQPSFGSEEMILGSILDAPSARPSDPEFRRCFGPGVVDKTMTEGKREIVDDSIDPGILVDLLRQFHLDSRIPSPLLEPTDSNWGLALDGLIDVVQWGLRRNLVRSSC